MAGLCPAGAGAPEPFGPMWPPWGARGLMQQWRRLSQRNGTRQRCGSFSLLGGLGTGAPGVAPAPPDPPD
jgi:hypothetical protein